MRHTCPECDFDIYYLHGTCLHKGEFGSTGCPFFRRERVPYSFRYLKSR